MRTAAVYNFLIEANIIAGVAILLMIPIRRWLRRPLGSRAICFAWLLVAVRLLCPLALPNPLINGIVTPYNYDQEAIRPMAGQVRVRVRDALSDASMGAAQAAMEEEGVTFAEAMRLPEYRRLSDMTRAIDSGRAAKTGMAVYVGGLGAVAAWMALANVRFRRRMKRNRLEALSGERLEAYRALCARYGVKPVPVYYVDPLPGACLVGVTRPYIALPLAAGDEQAKQMLAHEICHLKARDHLWTPVTLLCCVIHWFNPLVWAAADMSRMDRELKCDGLVTRDMDDEEKRRYAGTLIQSAARRTVPGMPVLATGMSMTGRRLKARVGGILHSGRRMKALAASFAAVATALLVLAFGTAATGHAVPEKSAAETRVALDAQWLAGLAPAQMGEYGPDHLIETDEQAVAYAKMLWTGPLAQWNITGATCSVFQIDEEMDSAGYDAYTVLPSGRSIGVVIFPWNAPYVVQLWLPNGHVLNATFHCDGRIIYLFNGDLDHYTAEKAPVTGTEEEREAIRQRILEIAELMEPGITEKIAGVVDLGDELLEDVRFANFVLQVPGEDERSVCVTLPDMILVEYGTGNG